MLPVSFFFFYCGLHGAFHGSRAMKYGFAQTKKMLVCYTPLDLALARRAEAVLGVVYAQNAIGHLCVPLQSG